MSDDSVESSADQSAGPENPAGYEAGGRAALLLLITLAVVAAALYLGHQWQSRPAGLDSAVAADTAGLLAWYPMNLNGKDALRRAPGLQRRRILSAPDAFTGAPWGAARFADKKSAMEAALDINPAALPVVTLMAWIKPDAYGGSDSQMVFTHDDGGYDRGLLLQRRRDAQGGRSASVAAFDGSGLTAELPVTLNEWNFVAVTYDQPGRQLTVYSGERYRRAPAHIGQGLDYLLIGSDWRGRSSFRGYMDDVAVFGRALSRDEAVRFASRETFRKAPEARDVYVYIVSANNVNVTSRADERSHILGSFTLGDTLSADTTVRGDDGTQMFIVIDHDGTPGFVSQAYLEKVTLSRHPMQAFADSYVNVTNWRFWVAVALIGLIVLGLIKTFSAIDGALLRMIGRRRPPGSPWHVTMAMTAGAALAILFVLQQYTVMHYFDAIVLWPAGQGWAVWGVWGILVAMLAVNVGAVLESFEKAGAIFGPLRALAVCALIQIVFIVTIVATAALIIIAILLFVVSMAISALTYRRVYKDAWGNTYVE